MSVTLIVAFALAVAQAQIAPPFVHAGGWRNFGMMARTLLRPDISAEFLLIVADASLLTVAYAIAGMTVAIVVGIPGALIASGVLVSRRGLRIATTVTARGTFGALRGMHELIWALLLVHVLGLSPYAGVLAIGVPYGATLARVLAEHLQNVPAPQLAALSSCGASRWQQLLYVRFPMAGADMAAYLAYRFECAIRAAAVLSFIGLGGIGYRLTLSLHDLRFDRVWTLVAALVAIIALVDLMSARLRRTVVA